MTLRVYLTGQRRFGAAVADLVIHRGHQLVGVAAPAFAGRDVSIPHAYGDDTEMHPDLLRAAATRYGVPWTESCRLTAEAIPDGTDVIIAAHSHAFVGRRSRARARLAAIGYHPSLLPLHRGRDAIRWTIRDGDKVTGGSVYHLTGTVDGGPIAAQDYALVPPGATPGELWCEVLFPLGLRLFDAVLDDLECGLVVAVPQDESCATWEPAFGARPLHRPELPELTTGRPDRLTFTGDAAALHRTVHGEG